MRRYLVAIGVSLFCLFGHCFADTFIHLQTGDQFHGFATQKIVGGKTLVYIKEKNSRKLINLANYEIHRDHHGRRNDVRIITIKETIDCDAVTKAVEEAIVNESNRGPLAILIEIDSQGNDFGLAKRICAAITKTNNCDVIAFVCGGKFGGAFSAAAMIPIACDKIYIAQTAYIGAGSLETTLQPTRETDQLTSEYILPPEQPVSFRTVSSYFKALAKSNNRPASRILSMVEPAQPQSSPYFRPPVAGQKRIERTSRIPDSVTTFSAREAVDCNLFSAREAVDCNLADCVVTSQDDVIRDMNTVEAKVIVNDAMQKTRVKLKKARRAAKKLLLSIDFNEQLSQALPTWREGGNKEEAIRTISKKLGVLHTLAINYGKTITLAKKFPSLRLDLAKLNSGLVAVKTDQVVLKQLQGEIKRQLAEEKRQEKERRRRIERSRPKERRHIPRVR